MCESSETNSCFLRLFLGLMHKSSLVLCLLAMVSQALTCSLLFLCSFMLQLVLYEAALLGCIYFMFNLNHI